MSARPRRRGHDASLDYHRRMIEDVHRMDAYERALRARVKPGDVVLDLGSGTGILAMLAARCGAARVHAVESMPVARLARELVAANGLEGRVIVHEADATTLPPVEPVDLVVSDFMGRYVIDDEMLDAVAAAGRWLKPGGGFIPERITLRLAPIGGFHMPALDWVENVVLGVDLRPLLPHVLHASYAGDFHDHLLLAAPQVLAEIVPPATPPFDRVLAFTVEKAGRLRGLCGWFDAALAPGIDLSTAPGIETHWGQVLYPLAATAVEPGDVITVHMRMVDEDPWEIEWATRVTRGDAVLLEARQDTRERPGERPVPATPLPDGDPIEINEQAGLDFQAGRIAEALAGWEAAVRLLPVGHEWSAPIYENLGIAYLREHQPVASARAFLRALDGDPAAREQSLRLLIIALRAAGKQADADRAEAAYKAAFPGNGIPIP